MAMGGEHIEKMADAEKQIDDGAQAKSKTEQPLPARERTVWGITYIKGKLEERKAKRKKENPADKTARLTTQATIWIAMFTVVLAILSGLTWWEIRTGGADTHDLAVAAKDQATAAKDLASAAKKQADKTDALAGDTHTLAMAASEANVIARTASRSVQRAFIVVDHLDIYAVRLPSGQVDRWIVNPVITNSGNTPTKNLFISINFGGQDMTNWPKEKQPPVEPPNFPSLSDIRKHQGWQRGVVGPHANTNFTVLNGFMAYGLRGPGSFADTGEFTYGAFIYGDVFDDRPRHITEFCFSMGRTTMVDEQFVPYGRCKQHNCADEECEGEQKAN